VDLPKPPEKNAVLLGECAWSVVMASVKTKVAETVEVNAGKAEIPLTFNGHCQKRNQTSRNCALTR
jgi:uracil-DNA glycosylase